MHHAGSTPVDLLAALCERADKKDLRKIRLTHGLLCGKKPWIAEKFHGTNHRANQLRIMYVVFRENQVLNAVS